MGAPYELASPSKAEMQALLDSPIDNAERASKVWLPLGKRPAMRGSKPEYLNEFAPAITGKEARERRADALDKKLGSILTYYASTDIPFDRIAAHTNLDAATVIRAMKARGRTA